MNEKGKNTQNSPISAKAQLRQKIVMTATEAFTKHGIKTITMDEVANSVGISKRTLYETFKDKEELLAECLQVQHKEMEEYMTRVALESENVLEIILMFYQKSIEMYHETNSSFFEDLNKYPKLKEETLHQRQENSERTIEIFNKGIGQGIFRDDVNFEIVHLLVREQVNLLLNTDVCSDYPFIDVLESIVFVYMRGISTEKGQKILNDFIKEHKQQK
ncbi:MAG: TetR/AcrR family transcriptional regulator [Bacteroidaceae bacterium]